MGGCNSNASRVCICTCNRFLHSSNCARVYRAHSGVLAINCVAWQLSRMWAGQAYTPLGWGGSSISGRIFTCPSSSLRHQDKIVPSLATRQEQHAVIALRKWFSADIIILTHSLSCSPSVVWIVVSPGAWLQSTGHNSTLNPPLGMPQSQQWSPKQPIRPGCMHGDMHGEPYIDS